MKEVDFFALYVIPKKTWYIIPSSVATRVTGPFWLWPHCTKRKHKYDIYSEAWDLLRVWKPKPASPHRVKHSSTSAV